VTQIPPPLTAIAGSTNAPAGGSCVHHGTVSCESGYELIKWKLVAKSSAFKDAGRRCVLFVSSCDIHVRVERVLGKAANIGPAMRRWNVGSNADDSSIMVRVCDLAFPLSRVAYVI